MAVYTKSPDAVTVSDWFVINVYSQSLRTHKIHTPSGFKTLYCNAKDIWSCRTQMMKYIDAHLSDFVTSGDEFLKTWIKRGYFGKTYSSPVRKDGKWYVVLDSGVPDSYPGKYRKVPSKPKNR